VGLKLIVFPIGIADFDYRYLLPVLPFACLAAAQAITLPRIPARDTGGAGLWGAKTVSCALTCNVWTT
jgi:hypothetical protein